MTAPQDRLFWTAGQVADLLDCSPRSVAKWVDGGQLRGARLPGSAHRRISRYDLDSFIRAYYGRTLDELLADASRFAEEPHRAG